MRKKNVKPKVHSIGDSIHIYEYPDTKKIEVKRGNYIICTIKDNKISVSDLTHILSIINQTSYDKGVIAGQMIGFEEGVDFLRKELKAMLKIPEIRNID